MVWAEEETRENSIPSGDTIDETSPKKPKWSFSEVAGRQIWASAWLHAFSPSSRGSNPVVNFQDFIRPYIQTRIHSDAMVDKNGAVVMPDSHEGFCEFRSIARILRDVNRFCEGFPSTYLGT
jgi:hypothetical protein